MNFWSSLTDPPPLSRSEIARLRDAIGSAPDQSRAFLIGLWERQYDEVRRDIESVRTRAAGLLAATGIISGVVTVAVPLAPARLMTPIGQILSVASLLIIACLLYGALAAVVLSVRAQQVGPWTQIAIGPKRDLNRVAGAYEIEYASSLYQAWRENVERLANYVGYLRDAQLYFRLVVMALTALVVVWIAAPFVPGGGSGVGGGAPSVSTPLGPAASAARKGP